jgi:hypothetical protein
VCERLICRTRSSINADGQQTRWPANPRKGKKRRMLKAEKN